MSATKHHYHNEIEAGQRTATGQISSPGSGEVSLKRERGIKEHPILFSTPMVQAELDGRKNQTRRTTGLELINENPDDWQFEWADYALKEPWRFTQISTVNPDSISTKTFNQLALKCPYGQPGDLLWVRESFSYMHFYPDNGQVVIQYLTGEQRVIEQYPHWILQKQLHKIKPSIHMPKAAARIWLEITEEKVERVQSISEEDAKAEGITPLLMSAMQLAISGQLYLDYSKPKQFFNEGLTPFWSFNSLWCSINGGDSWEANPWVWVVKFKVLSTTGRPTLNIKL